MVRNLIVVIFSIWITTEMYYKRCEVMNKEDKLKIAKYDLRVAKQTAGRKKMDPKKKREWKLKLKKAERDVKKLSK